MVAGTISLFRVLHCGDDMSNLWINIRFGCRHFQVSRDRPYISWTYNPAHEGNPTNKWFAIYCLFGKHL